LIQVVGILFGYMFCLYRVAFRCGAVRAKYGRLDLVRERIADGIPLRRFADRALDLQVVDLAAVALPAELARPRVRTTERGLSEPFPGCFGGTYYITATSATPSFSAPTKPLARPLNPIFKKYPLSLQVTTKRDWRLAVAALPARQRRATSAANWSAH
jgi:hypothetical protein